VTRHRDRRGVLSPKRILWGAVAVVGGVVIAVLHGGFSEIGHVIVQKSQIIQHQIQVIQQEIENWITKRLHSDQSASMGPDDLAKQCMEQAIKMMPTEGLPGFLESKARCLKKAGDPHVL